MTGAADFFYENAGWGYDPASETPEQGKRRSARELATAEARITDLIDAGRARYTTLDDDTIDCGDIPRDEYMASVEEFGNVGIILEVACPCCDKFDHVASLWGIVGDENYHRVIRAELADDYLSEQSAC